MKKISLLILFASIFNSSFGWIKATTAKNNGGWFGYSNVTEQLTRYGTNCQFNLYCTDPGWSRCRFTTFDIANASSLGCQAISVNVEEETWYDILDESIEELIATGYTSGTLIRQDIQVSHPVTFNMEDAVVTWTYSASNAILEMTIYSYNEADALGII